MAFYIRKSLAQGAIRFGVVPRGTADVIDRTGSLSTGPRGEFLRKRHRGFFFGEDRAVRTLDLPKDSGLAGTPFWKSVFDGSQQGWIYLAMIVVGTLFTLLGLTVLVKKGAQGWLEIVIGLALVATPLVRTANTRRVVREREAKERAERETTERRHREMLSAYTAALTRLRENPNDETLAAVALERERLELPYEFWSPLARQAVLEIGFEALARSGSSRAAEVNELVKRAAAAVGLAASDEWSVRLGLYRVAAWHLLADDRAGDAQVAALDALRQGLDIGQQDVPAEEKAAEEFARLRGVTPAELPREECTAPMGFHEYCVRVARGSLMKRTREKESGRRIDKLSPDETVTLVITNKRLRVDAKKPIEIPLGKIDDVELDADTNVLTIRTARRFRTIDLQVEDPIYTGALLELAMQVDERPRGWS